MLLKPETISKMFANGKLKGEYVHPFNFGIGREIFSEGMNTNEVSMNLIDVMLKFITEAMDDSPEREAMPDLKRAEPYIRLLFIRTYLETPYTDANKKKGQEEGMLMIQEIYNESRLMERLEITDRGQWQVVRTMPEIEYHRGLVPYHGQLVPYHEGGMVEYHGELVPYKPAGQLQVYEDDRLRNMEIVTRQKLNQAQMIAYRQEMQLLMKERMIYELRNENLQQEREAERRLITLENELQNTYGAQIHTLQIEMRRTEEYTEELKHALVTVENQSEEAKRHNVYISGLLLDKTRRFSYLASQIATFETLLTDETKEKVRQLQPVTMGKDAKHKSPMKHRMAMIQMSRDPEKYADNLELELFQDVVTHIPLLIEENKRYANEIKSIEELLQKTESIRAKADDEKARSQKIVKDQETIIQTMEEEIKMGEQERTKLSKVKESFEQNYKRLKDEYSQLESKTFELQHKKVLHEKEQSDLKKEITSLQKTLEHEKSKKKQKAETISSLEEEIRLKESQIGKLTEYVIDAELQIKEMSEVKLLREASRSIAVGMTPQIKQKVTETGTSPIPFDTPLRFHSPISEKKRMTGSFGFEDEPEKKKKGKDIFSVSDDEDEHPRQAWPDKSGPLTPTQPKAPPPATANPHIKQDAFKKDARATIEPLIKAPPPPPQTEKVPTRKHVDPTNLGQESSQESKPKFENETDLTEGMPFDHKDRRNAKGLAHEIGTKLANIPKADLEPKLGARDFDSNLSDFAIVRNIFF